MEELSEDKLFDLAYEVSDLDRKPADEIERIARTVYERDKQLRFKRLSRALISCLYKIGAIGLKLKSTQSYIFSYEQSSINETDIVDGTKFIVHPMLVPSLGCRFSSKKRGLRSRLAD